MNNFKKLALAASVGSLLLGANAAQAHVSYNLNSSVNGNVGTDANWTTGAPSDLGGNAYVGNLPANWIVNVHNTVNAETSYTVSDDLAIAAGAPGTFDLQSHNNKWNPASSWGAALGYGLLKLEANAIVNITVSADDGSTFTPGFTLWNNWDETATSSKHGPWNADPFNPETRGSAELTYNAHSATTTAGGSATISKYLSAGMYSIWLGGNGTGATVNGTTGEILADQSYMVNVTTSAVPVPAAAWLFGGALMSLVGARRRKNVLPA